jgi:hypothetical protein
MKKTNKKLVGDPTWKRIEPSIIHPFLCLHEKFEKGKVALPTFSNNDDAFIVSVGVVLALHDLTPGAIRITERIWPPNFLSDYDKWVFLPEFGDKTLFIEAAIKNVEANLASTEPAEREQSAKRIIFAILVSLIVICIFELSVWLIPFTPLTWLKNHPNSYGIQGSVIFFVPCLIFGLFKPRWRNWCWGTAALAFLGLILSLLGGRSR